MGFRDFLSRLNPFRAAKPAAPTGFAAYVDEQRAKSIPAPQPEAVAAAFATDEVDSFVHFGTFLKVQSSNVAGATYDPEASKLTIEFLDKGAGPAFYEYEDVSIREAEAFARAASKGKFVWDALRLRGTIFGHRKPYQFLSGASTYQPAWMRRPSTRKLHGQVGPEGERNVNTLKSLMPRGWQRAAKKFGP